MMRSTTAAAGTENHAPEPLPWLEAAAGHGDDQRIVAGQQDVDPDDLGQVHPELGVGDLGAELREERAEPGSSKSDKKFNASLRAAARRAVTR